MYSWLRRDDEKGLVGVRWGRAMRELVAQRGGEIPTGRRHGETMQGIGKRGIIELSVQRLIQAHRYMR